MMKQRGPYDLQTYTPFFSRHCTKVSLCNWQMCCCSARFSTNWLSLVATIGRGLEDDGLLSAFNKAVLGLNPKAVLDGVEGLL